MGTTQNEHLITLQKERCDNLFRHARKVTGWNSEITIELVACRKAIGKYNFQHSSAIMDAKLEELDLKLEAYEKRIA